MSKELACFTEKPKKHINLYENAERAGLVNVQSDEVKRPLYEMPQ
jgi:hypothetical protein